MPTRKAAFTGRLLRECRCMLTINRRRLSKTRPQSVAGLFRCQWKTAKHVINKKLAGFAEKKSGNKGVGHPPGFSTSLRVRDYHQVGKAGGEVSKKGYTPFGMEGWLPRRSPASSRPAPPAIANWVVSYDKGGPLYGRQVFQHYDRNCRQCARCQQPCVAGDHVIVGTDQNWVREAELAD